DALATGATEGQRGIDLVLDLDYHVQDHRPATGHVHLVAVHPRVLAGFRIETVDAELPHLLGAGRCLEHLAGLDARVRRQSELCHDQYTLAFGGTTSTSSVRVFRCTGR